MEFDIDFMESYDRDSVAAELRRVAAITGKNTVSTRDIERLARLSMSTVFEKFGTLAKAQEAAGLDASSRRKYTDDEVLRYLADLWTITLKESGRSPIISDIKKYGLPFSWGMILNRFGTWRKALVAAHDAAKGRTPQPFEKSRHQRKPISARTRFEVFKRDLYTCQICRQAGVALVLDHVIPVCRGGSNSMENLQALCVDCNQGKGGNLQ